MDPFLSAQEVAAAIAAGELERQADQLVAARLDVAQAQALRDQLQVLLVVVVTHFVIQLLPQLEQV